VDEFAIHLDVVASGGALSAIAGTVVAGTIIAIAVRLLRRDIFNADRLQRSFLQLIAAVGAVLIFMQLLGFLFAADIYLSALGLSIVFILLIKTISDILERWLLILRARLERKTRNEIKAIKEGGEQAVEEAGDLQHVVALSNAHGQLLSLLRMVAFAVVLWLIWAPSLPALNLLDSVTLWEIADASDAEDGLRSVTLFDLLLSLVALVLTGLVAKQLPSLLQVLLQEWMNVSAGARYAMGMLLQYVVFAIGGSIFLSLIGWDWSKVQWLVAALGVGIGFGLQEIVANFISGLIILFERPIRVGDIITAGGAEGTVREIKARATIIETFEGKEHLIPNKELITGPVINWTLSTNSVRILIQVGIAYGSDVRRALDLLLEAAAEVDLVLNEPAPRATFDDFGDNALVVLLRCYVAEDRLKAWTELRHLINDKFNQAGIVIAFPQRDVHLDVQGPLRVELGRDPGTA
jgi:potassium efflux system protein